MRNVPSLEAIAQDYSPRGVRFYYVYKSLAHPGWSGIVHPQSLEERLLHVAEAKRTLGTQIPWLSDSMDDRFAKALGGAPNSEFLIGPLGTIVSRRAWNSPKLLRETLVDLLGPVENPTSPDDLNLPAPRAAVPAASQIVPRLSLPRDMVPIQVLHSTEAGEEPCYAKLSAKVTSDLMFFGGPGKLLLEFALDPVHHVHWNNTGGPLEVRIEGPESIGLSSRSLTGPVPVVETDDDSRQFLIDVRNWQAGESLTVQVAYLVCSDREGWCKPVQHRMRVRCEVPQGPGVPLAPEHYPRMLQALDYRDGPKPIPVLSATADQVEKLVGDWSMRTSELYRTHRWKLHLRSDKDGLRGWTTYDPAGPEIDLLSFDGKNLRFLQLSGPVPEEIVLKLDQNQLVGTHLSVFGDFSVRGKRLDPAPAPGAGSGKPLKSAPASSEQTSGPSPSDRSDTPEKRK